MALSQEGINPPRLIIKIPARVRQPPNSVKRVSNCINSDPNSTAPASTSMHLTRGELKRKRDAGEDVQLLGLLDEEIPKTVKPNQVTSCLKLELGPLLERYCEEHREAVKMEGSETDLLDAWLSREVEVGDACFRTMEASGFSMDDPPKCPQQKGVPPTKKRKKGDYIVDEHIPLPDSASGWKHMPKTTQPQTSHRPPPKPRPNTTKSNRNARHGKSKNKRRGGWQVTEDMSRKDRMQQMKNSRSDVHKNSSFSMEEDTLVTDPGWNGRPPQKESQKEIIRQWKDGSIKDTLQSFHKVHVTDLLSPAILTDSQDRIFLYRTDQRPWLKKDLGPKFLKLCDLLTSGTNYKSINLKDTRGPHFPIIIGHQRQYTDKPQLTLFHKQNYLTVRQFIESPLTVSISDHVTNVLGGAFPGVKERYKKCADWHWEKYGIRPLFGLFWNFCYNVPHPRDKRVHCHPHTDHKNIVGVCAVLVYELPGSNFNHKRRSWLVIWDAGVMLEAAPWMITYYPSALFYHFNIDPCDLELVSVPEGETPTKDNSAPLDDSQGRGSMVFFNQASLFQSSETGFETLEKAKKNKVSTVRDFGADVNACFQKHGKSVPL